MAIESIGAIILSIILAAASYYMFIFANVFFDTYREDFDEVVPLATKFKVAAIDIVSLYVAHLVIKAIGLKGFIYKLLPSRCDNVYVGAILFVLLVVPLALAISRLAFKRCANTYAMVDVEFEYLIIVLAIVPTVITGILLTVGVGYVLVAYAIPLYLIGFVASYYVLRMFI